MINTVWATAFVFTIKGNTKLILKEVLVGKNKNQCLGKLELFSI